MIVNTNGLSKVNLEYVMDNAEVLLYAIEQAERFEVLSEQHDLALKQNKRYRELLEKIMYEEQTQLEGYESELHKEIREVLGMTVADAFGLEESK